MYYTTAHDVVRYLKKNLNAPRPSKHPPVRGKKCSLTLTIFLVDQNWSERNLSALLRRTLVVGRRQRSESIETALDME